jgi:lipopolysaccharide biosynthesis glycosyltransferase
MSLEVTDPGCPMLLRTGGRPVDIRPRRPLSPSATSQVLNLVTQSDEHYVQHLSAMLVSLFEKNRNNVINVFVLIPHGIREYLLDTLMEISTKFSQGLHFFQIDRQMLNGLRVVNHVTSAVYHKLFMGEILPNNISRVIYLDADIIVRADLGGLWRHDLGNSVVGAVADPNVESIVGIKTKLGLRPDASYFNSGVLLVDLDRWRNISVGLDTLRFVRDHCNRMSFNDQCALNWVLRDRWTPLPDCWNLQSFAVTNSRWGYMYYTKEAQIRAKAAKIIHFTGGCKPWHYMNNHPLKHEYFRYLSKTQWKAYEYDDYSLRNVIRKNLYRFAPTLLRTYYWIRWRRMTKASS